MPKHAIVSIVVRLRVGTRQVRSVIIVDSYGHLVFGEETDLLELTAVASFRLWPA